MAIKISKGVEVFEIPAWNGLKVSSIVGNPVSKEQPSLPVTLSGWLVEEFTPEDTKEKAAQRAYSRVSSGYSTDISAEVEASGHTWRGGEESAVELDRSIRLTERAGGTTVLTTPLDVPSVELPIADAVTAALTIANIYTVALTTKKQKDAEIAAIAADPAGTIAQLDAVVW